MELWIFAQEHEGAREGPSALPDLLGKKKISNFGLMMG
jgi:hypothetical protein